MTTAALVALDTSWEWQVARRYFSAESLARLAAPDADALAAPALLETA